MYIYIYMYIHRYVYMCAYTYAELLSCVCVSKTERASNKNVCAANTQA